VGDRFKQTKNSSRCYDVFQDFKLNDSKMYEYKTTRNLVMYKLKRDKLKSFHARIRILKSLKAFSGHG